MNSKVSSAFLWKFLERIGAQGISFILTIILARLLTPTDYGVVALVTVFISLATTFVQCGFNSALIQKKEISDTDYSSGLIVSIGIAAILYFLLFVCAPQIADFYNVDELIKITRVLALLLFPGAITSIQIAKLTRELQFKPLFFASTSATLASAFIGIFLAWKQCGVWALVAQQVSVQVFSCLFLLLCTRWKLQLVGFKDSVAEMVPFGSRILASNLLVTVFLNLRTLIIGRVYSSDDLGYFNRGKQFPQALMESINGTIQTVLLPVYSRKQDSKKALTRMVRTSVRISNYLIFPVLVGLCCVAEPMIQLLLTDKWLPCIPYIRYFAIAYLCQPTQIATAQAMRAVGDSKTPLKLEIIRKIIEISLLAITVPISVDAIGMSSAICGVLSIAIAMRANEKVIEYSVKEQIADIAEPLVYSLIMALIVIVLSGFVDNNIIKILFEIVIGIITYPGISIVMKSKCLNEAIHLIKHQTGSGH